jgi:hypothetical protein
MPRAKAKPFPFTAPGVFKKAVVDVPSFTKGLVTLVPSDAAGFIAAPQAGMQQSPQAEPVQFGPDSKDAVVVASNVRFRDMSTLSAPGYQRMAGAAPPTPINLIFLSQQLGTSIPLPGVFLIFADETDIYVASPQ